MSHRIVKFKSWIEKLHPTRLLIVSVLLTVALFIIMMGSMWIMYNTYAQMMTTELELVKLIGMINQYDEILTMSARMAAATGDTQWEERYRDFEPGLDAAIKEIIDIAPEAYEKANAEQTDAANIALVAMENQAFALVRKGENTAALELLSSEEYLEQKQIYATAMAESHTSIRQRAADSFETVRQYTFSIALLIISTILVLLGAWSAVLVIVQRYDKNLVQARDELEDRVRERTAELEQAQQAVIESQKQAQQEIIESQQQAIRELSTPVIPVMNVPGKAGSIIVMPLIGSIDSMRARDITRSLLAGISEHQAKVVILDVTGVAVMDSGVVNHLNKTIQTARLKGASAIVTGISEIVAETIVDLGIDWGTITTLPDLQTGLGAALNSLGFELRKVYDAPVAK